MIQATACRMRNHEALHHSSERFCRLRPPNRAALECRMPCFNYAADAFGDAFAIDKLPLPRPAGGYAVQMLGSDRLLDRHSGNFLPVRSPDLAGLFDTFASARQAAAAWVDRHCRTPAEHRLAIVPAAFDDVLERHVLIYGVLAERL